MEYRPLEGFVFAVSPFNFTAIGGNLTGAPALMGNTVLWKPASTAMLSAYYTMRIFQEAGLPDGVINLVYGSGKDIGDPALASPRPRRRPLHRLDARLPGHVEDDRRRTSPTTAAIRASSARPAARTSSSRTRPRTPRRSRPRSCAAPSSTRARSARRPRACTRPRSMWPAMRERLVAQVGELKFGDVSDFSNFMGAVIDASSFATQREAIEEAQGRREERDRRRRRLRRQRGLLRRADGDPHRGSRLPAPARRALRPGRHRRTSTRTGSWEETLELIDRTAPYALTGAIFAGEREAVIEASDVLRYTAGNFYVNDKPTGAVVGQQPFGGARASGTNDKAGSMWNLIRWVSPRTIKETFVPPTGLPLPLHVPGRRVGRSPMPVDEGAPAAETTPSHGAELPRGLEAVPRSVFLEGRFGRLFRLLPPSSRRTTS